MEEKPGTFTDLFGYLATPANPETLAVEYISREFRTGRPIGEIFEDEYLTERFTPEQLEALLDRWDLNGLLGEEGIEQYRNPEPEPEPEIEEGEEDEDDGDGDGDEDDDDSEAELEAEAQSGEDEGAADESPDAWAAEWAGVEIPAAENAEKPEASEDADSDDSSPEKPA